jgi:type II secretory pathway pseudopilin PulG
VTIAVAIVASLVAVAATALRPATDRMRLEAEAREMEAILGALRTQAITRRVAVGLRVARDGRAVTYGDPALTRTLPATIGLRMVGEGGARRDLVFFPEGGATGGTLRLDDGRRAISLSVNGLTGRITLAREAGRGG